MPSYNMTATGVGQPALPLKQCFTVSRRISFVTHPREAADLSSLIDLPANSLVGVLVNRITSEGGAATIDIKTSEVSPQVFLDDGSINGTGILYGDASTGAGAMVWLFIPVATTLDVLTNTASTGTAVIDVKAVIFPFETALTAAVTT